MALLHDSQNQGHRHPLRNSSIDSGEATNLGGGAREEKSYSRGYWRARSAPKPTFPKSLLAVSVLSLTVVYVVLGCFRHVSFASKARLATRSLSAGGSGEGFCPGWSKGGNEEDLPKNEQDLQGRGPAARGSPATSGRERRVSSARFWRTRRMPLLWQRRFEELLQDIQKLPSIYMTLLPWLRPSDAVSLGELLARVGAIELSALAYVPDQVQPLRAQGTAAFSCLLESLLSSESTLRAAQQMELTQKIVDLKRFFDKVGGIPEQTEIFKDYRATMVSWWTTGRYTAAQVRSQLDSLLPEAEQHSATQENVEKVLKVLHSVFQTRKMQLLGSRTMRHWMVSCQSGVRSWLLYREIEFIQAPSLREQQQIGPVNEVYNAVVEAGGRAVPSPVKASDFKQFRSMLLRESRLLSTAGAADSPREASPPDSFTPLSMSRSHETPPFLGPRSFQLAQHSSGPGQASTQVQPQPELRPSSQDVLHSAYSMQLTRPDDPSFQLLQTEQMSGRLQQLGARPREGTPLRAQTKAQQLGWFGWSMPSEWYAKMEHLLQSMQTIAFTCDDLTPSLSPLDAVRMAMNLSMLAAVQLSVMAYLPADLQPLRAAVGGSYCQLLEKVLVTELARSAAGRMLLAGRIASLKALIRKISNVPPFLEAVNLGQYMNKIAAHYRVCKYVSEQVLALMNRLSAHNVTGRVEVQFEAVMKALEMVFHAMKMHLLVDPVFRIWFITCQEGALAHLLYTPQDLEKAYVKTKLTSQSLMRRLQRLFRLATVTPFEVGEARASTYEQKQFVPPLDVVEQSSAHATHPHRQALQRSPEAAVTESPLSLSYASHMPSSESRHMPGSEQAPSASAPPSRRTEHPYSSAYDSSTFSGTSQQPLWSPFVEGYYQVPGAFPGLQYYSSRAAFPGQASSEGLASGDDEQQHGSAGGPAGALGLLDLASRLSKLHVSDSEEDDRYG
ncbi:hypothetical protein Emag_000514 [Eimeria magna]